MGQRSENTLINPTYNGFISTTIDAALLFEACLTGQLDLVTGRPQQRQRDALIRSGNVFVYDEQSSGIKRWTDGISWSPSRVMGDFLVYREFHGSNPSRKTCQNLGGLSGHPIESHGSSPLSVSNDTQVDRNKLDIFREGRNITDGSNTRPIRQLVGSLTNPDLFKETGLVKKTISAKIDDRSLHLVSYYTVEEAMSKAIVTPSEDVRLGHLRTRQEVSFASDFHAGPTELEHRAVGGRKNMYSGWMVIPHGTKSPQTSPQIEWFSPQIEWSPSLYPPGIDYLTIPFCQYCNIQGHDLSHLKCGPLDNLGQHCTSPSWEVAGELNIPNRPEFQHS